MSCKQVLYQQFLEKETRKHQENKKMIPAAFSLSSLAKGKTSLSGSGSTPAILLQLLELKTYSFNLVFMIPTRGPTFSGNSRKILRG
jgi:hypothetical protein